MGFRGILITPDTWGWMVLGGDFLFQSVLRGFFLGDRTVCSWCSYLEPQFDLYFWRSTPPKKGPFSIKTRVISVLGIYIYTHIFFGIYSKIGEEEQLLELSPNSGLYAVEWNNFLFYHIQLAIIALFFFACQYRLKLIFETLTPFKKSTGQPHSWSKDIYIYIYLKQIESTVFSRLLHFIISFSYLANG